MSRIARFFGWLIFMVLSTGVAGYAFYFFSGVQLGWIDENTTGALSQLRDKPLWFYAHVGGGGLALLLAPWQFASPVRNRWPLVHRIMGRFYVLAILIGGIAGLSMAISSDAGPVAQFGFGFLAVFWLTTTALALWNGYRRNIPAHRRWMIRSTALTLAAVTLRLYLGATVGYLIPTFGFTFISAYVVISWACWVPNLIVAELWIRKELGSKRTPHALQMAD